MEYPFASSPGLAMLPCSYLCTFSLSKHGKLKRPWLRVQQLNHQCAINVTIILNPKHSMFQLIRRELIFLPKPGSFVFATIHKTFSIIIELIEAVTTLTKSLLLSESRSIRTKWQRTKQWKRILILSSYISMESWIKARTRFLKKT